MCDILFKGLNSGFSFLKVLLLALLLCNIGTTIYIIVTLSGDQLKVYPFIGIEETPKSKNEDVLAIQGKWGDISSNKQVNKSNLFQT